MESVDFDKHRSWLVKRVLEKGSKQDWDQLQKFYGKPAIAESVKTMRSLEKRAHSFACAMLDLQPTECRCYTNRQSHATHWNY